MLLHQMRFMLAGTIAVGIAILLAAEYGHGKKKTAVIDPIKAEWREGENRAALDKLEGNAPPALTLKDWTNGDAVNLDDLKGKVVLVDFWAPWCGPCKMIAPLLDELATEYDGRVKIAKVNIDDHQNLAAQFRVSAIPTLLIFKNGQVVEQMVGAKSKRDLKASLDKAAA